MIQNIYETHLHVRNLEKAINFYQNKLGLTLVRKLSKEEWLSFGSEKIKTNAWTMGSK